MSRQPQHSGFIRARFKSHRTFPSANLQIMPTTKNRAKLRFTINPLREIHTRHYIQHPFSRRFHQKREQECGSYGNPACVDEDHGASVNPPTRFPSMVLRITRYLARSRSIYGMRI
ncbi:hypothetical protein BCR33DRAFT_114831 [Rhizoclosmatium globosum]|uniref:Uncharacterized protein n=1 Tax=Rhizoclosmatium globosum TaxID=329046 RepID=A0A1Y2CIY7_9FUNG|nr:hypothetical protein BCR33DRAFT_114831 [Rhizoclosmatium globosum]|eukprot:ORY47001.1 hypothetical protein BCR33DRAFT_114831 [Rhizoclosmatium globosum]